MRVKVFWCEEAGKLRRALRRYADGPCPNMSGRYSYHNTTVPLDEVVLEPRAEVVMADTDADEFAGDPRWPSRCSCGYEFREGDSRQVSKNVVYRRTDTGEEFILREAPVGAMWDACWMSERGQTGMNWFTGSDGISLVVKTPGGDWMVDSRANNCTMPEDNTHYCWVRHGDPRTGHVHVDKQGHTCAAGAGSIAQGDRFHGFLHNGELYDC